MSRFSLLLSYRLFFGSVNAGSRVAILKVPKARGTAEIVSLSGHSKTLHGDLHLRSHHCCACSSPVFQPTYLRRSYLPLQNDNSPLSLVFPHQHWISAASYSTKTTPESKKTEENLVSNGKGESSAAEETEARPSIFQRFKRAYKEHGKVLVAVHVATSIVWYGSFYAAARCGLDLVPWMEQWGFSETVIKPFRAGGLGDFALAYLMYKLATPARYTVTLAGTNVAIRHLRGKGKMAPKSQEDSLRQLYKDSKQQLKNSNLRKERLKRLREAREKKKERKWRQGKHF